MEAFKWHTSLREWYLTPLKGGAVGIFYVQPARWCTTLFDRVFDSVYVCAWAHFNDNEECCSQSIAKITSIQKYLNTGSLEISLAPGLDNLHPLTSVPFMHPCQIVFYGIFGAEDSSPRCWNRPKSNRPYTLETDIKGTKDCT